MVLIGYMRHFIEYQKLTIIGGPLDRDLEQDEKDLSDQTATG